MPKSGIHAEIRRLKKKQEAQEASDAGDDGSDLVSSKPKSLKARSSALAAPLKSISQNDVEKWFKSQGWTAFDFQKEAWLAQMNGE
ncbi:MAG: hypothetical protein V4692_15660, partial [Bdellovibrionota bacterium]